MTAGYPDTLRASLLLFRLGARRRLNTFAAMLRGGGRKPVPGARTGTADKSTRGWIAGVLGAGFMLFMFASLSLTSVANLERALGGRRAAEPGLTLAPDVISGAALSLALLIAANAAIGFGGRNQELSKAEWDLEWLVTLPVPLPALVAVRVLERAVMNVLGWVLFFPYLATFGWSCGLRLAAIPVAAALALVLLFVVALASTLAETWLRFTFAPARLRNFQAFITLGALGVFYLAISPGMSGARDAEFFFFRWARAMPAWVRATPTGLLAAALASATPAGLAGRAALLALEVGGLAALAFAALARLLRGGVVATGARESGGRGLPALDAAASVPTGSGRRRFLTPIQAKELRLLGRDRNFLVQTLVMPAVLLGAQAAFNPGVISAALASATTLGVLAFSLGAYGLMLSAFQVLNSEGASIWLLFSLPQPLEAIVRQKAALWAVLALVLPTMLLAAGFVARGTLGVEELTIAAVVLGGIPIFAAIGASLGVLALNALDPEPQRRVRPGTTYLFMLLSGLYSSAIYATTLWNRVALAGVTALLAVALWQKARDRLPYLLDPVAAPPARAGLADGLIAAEVLFALQGFAWLGYEKATGCEPGPLTLLVAALCGAAAGHALLRVIFRWTRAADVPRFFGPRPGRAIVSGAALGALAAAACLGWLALVERAGGPIDGARAALRIDPHGRPWFIALAVILPPLLEEFAFRGLVHRGLRARLRAPVAALASAAVYAIVQPRLGAPPAFAIGACAAIAYDRSGILLAPAVARAVCTALVIAVATARA